MFGKTLTKRDIRRLNDACDELREGCGGGCLQVGWCKACFDLCRSRETYSAIIGDRVGGTRDGGGKDDAI